MSQATPTIGSGETGTSYRTKDSDGKKAANTAHKGATPPTYAEAGYSWIDDSADPLWVERKFKGGTVADLANWPIIAEIDSSVGLTRPRLRRKILSKTAAYPATVADQGAFILADPTSGAFTIKLPAASAAGAGFAIGFRNDGTGNDLTVQRADATSDTVDGATSVAVAPGETLELVLNASTGWKTAAGSGSADNKKLLVSGTDTTEGYLGAKVSGTNGVSATTINGGSNEQVQLALNIDGLTGEGTFADDDQFAKQKASAGNRRKFTWAQLKTAILSLLPLTATYTSADTAISASATTAFTHGLGVIPKIVRVYLVCQTNEAGYIAGDVIEAGGFDGGTSNANGYTVQLDATNVSLIVASSPLLVIGKATHARVSLTLANWKWRVIAYK